MTFKASLHNHSMYSDTKYEKTCRKTTPLRIVRNSLKGNLDAVAVTDTDSDRFFPETFGDPIKALGMRYETQVLEGDNVALVLDTETGKQVYVYNGIEMHERNPGHILVVGHQGSLMNRYQKLDLRDRLLLGREAGGIVIAPHPLSELAGGIGEENVRKYKELLDAIEGRNAQLVLFLSKANTQAKRLAVELNIPAIASADSNYGEVDLCYVDLNEAPSRRGNGIRHIEEVREQIRGKRFKNSDARYLKPTSFLRQYFLDWFVLTRIRMTLEKLGLNKSTE